MLVDNTSNPDEKPDSSNQQPTPEFRLSPESLLPRNRSLNVTLFNSLGGIVWEADGRDFRFLFVSRQAEEVLGYPLEQWLDEPDFWISHIHPEDRDRSLAFCLDSIQRRRNHEFDYRMLARDGHIVWLHNIVSASADVEGNPRLRGIMLDISERKRAAEDLTLLQATALAISEAKDLNTALSSVLQKICETTSWDFGQVWLLRPEHVLPEFSPAWYASSPDFQEFRQYSEALEFVPGLDPAGKAWQSRKSIWLEDISPEKNGPWGLAASKAGFRSSMAFPLGTDQILGVLEFFSRSRQPEDPRLVKVVSAVAAHLGTAILRMQAQENTLRWKNRYETAIRASRQILYDWSPATDEMTFGGPIETILGYKGEELNTAQKWIRIIHAEDREAYRLELEHAVFDHKPFHLEYRIQHKDGRTLIVLDDGHFYLDESGNIERLVGFVVDVTEHRSLQEQFLQAQKMEAIGQLAGGVAHDFNNILAVLSGSVELLLEILPEDSPATETLYDMLQATDRASSLTRQLLSFSRKQVLAPRVLDLNNSVEDTRKMLRRLIGEDVELSTDLQHGLWHIKADTGQIEQVLVNLAVNARDAMPRGGKLTIKTRNIELETNIYHATRELRPGRYVLLSVTDTGAGIAEELHRRIFEPFFTTKAPGKGTGLGLATVQSIVNQAGGSIVVESALGRGTTFGLYVPVTTEFASHSKSIPDLSQKLRGRETILLAEDDPNVRALTRRILELRGYSILEAKDGHEALEVAAAFQGVIHLLLTDVVMPRMGGDTLSRKLLEQRPQIKVLYISGYTGDALLHHGVAQQEIGILQKPFTVEGLTRSVRETLDSRSP